MDANSVRPQLEALETVLAQHGENASAGMIRAALDGSEEGLHAFLVSNDLWGGAGSIADQAGISRGRDARRSVEVALLNLGTTQMRAGIVNVRTGTWVEVFSVWQREGV